MFGEWGGRSATDPDVHNQSPVYLWAPVENGVAGEDGSGSTNGHRNALLPAACLATRAQNRADKTSVCTAVQ